MAASIEKPTEGGAAAMAVPALDVGAATAVLRLPRDATEDAGECGRSSSVPARLAAAWNHFVAAGRHKCASPPEDGDLMFLELDVRCHE